LEAAQYNALTAFPSPWPEYGKRCALCNDFRLGIARPKPLTGFGFYEIFR
jgi:hypothetical protein